MHSDTKKPARIERISLQQNKGAVPIPVAEAPCVAGQGLRGDRHFGTGDGTLSFLGVETEALLPGLAAEGLCVARFSANVLTRGLDYKHLAAGTRFYAGGILFEVARAGKRCFMECRHFAARGPCALAGGCAFARPLSSGVLHRGDAVVLV
ncbi:MAG: hypothetical protein GXY32_02835 [Ruminococcaceae bacterium]|nr:hypothetical protein [Oscillospiraceae bacterium]